VSQAGFSGDVGEGAVVIVVIEVAGRSFVRCGGFESGAIHNENIRPAVIVVIEDGDARASCFDDVFFGVFAAENDRRSEPGFLRYIGEMHNRLSVRAAGTTGADNRCTGGLQ
jgi:hypothetical protein